MSINTQEPAAGEVMFTPIQEKHMLKRGLAYLDIEEALEAFPSVGDEDSRAADSYFKNIIGGLPAHQPSSSAEEQRMAYAIDQGFVARSGIGQQFMREIKGTQDGEAYDGLKTYKEKAAFRTKWAQAPWDSMV